MKLFSNGIKLAQAKRATHRVPRRAISRHAMAIIAFVIFSVSTSYVPETIVVAESPHRERNNLVCMPVYIDGNSFRFALDTGAAIHGIDEEILRLLGSSVGAVTLKTDTGDLGAALFTIPTLHIADRPSAVTYAAAIDTQRLELSTGQKLDGVLAAHALYLGPIAIFRGRVAVFWDDEAEFFPDDELHLSLDRFGCIYTGDFSAGEFQEFVLIDTGFTGGIRLSTPLFEGLIIAGQINVVGTEAYATAHGEAEARSGILRSLRLGRFQLYNVPVREGKSSAIGLEVLANFDALIDVQAQRMLIRNANSNWTMGETVVQATGTPMPQHRPPGESGNSMLGDSELSK